MNLPTDQIRDHYCGTTDPEVAVRVLCDFIDAAHAASVHADALMSRILDIARDSLTRVSVVRADQASMLLDNASLIAGLRRRIDALEQERDEFAGRSKDATEAWDQGYHAGHHAGRHHLNPGQVPNPYRRPGIDVPL